MPGLSRHAPLYALMIVGAALVAVVALIVAAWMFF